MSERVDMIVDKACELLCVWLWSRGEVEEGILKIDFVAGDPLELTVDQAEGPANHPLVQRS